MRTPLLASALILPIVLLLAGAINARASQANQTAPHRNTSASRSSPTPVAKAAIAGNSRSKAIAAEVRKDERFVSFLLKREDQAIAAQERSLRAVGRLEARLRDLDRQLQRSPRSHVRLQKLIDATRREISVLVRASQLREWQIADSFVQEDRVLKRIEQIAPQAAGLRVLLRRMAEQFRAIESVVRLQTTVGVAPLPRATTTTPTFPPGKPAASPIQA